MRVRMIGLRWAELIKFTIAFLFGFCFKSLWDFKDPEECKPCPEPSGLSSQIVQQPRINVGQDSIGVAQGKINPPFAPKNMYEVLRYDYLNKSYNFNNFDDDPKHGLLRHEKSDLNDIIEQTLVLYNEDNDSPLEDWVLQKLRNCYRRIDPLRGEDYVLDIDIKAKYSTDVHSKRFKILKPFNRAVLLEKSPLSVSTMIHFILPVTKDHAKVNDFLSNFENVCLKSSENIYLMVVLFITADDFEDNTFTSVEYKVKTIKKKYRNAHISILRTSKPFSRALGLDLGAKQFPETELLFFCDVDMRFTSDFLTRCRNNAVFGEQVYYPIVFSQYDPDIVRGYSPPERASNLMNIDKYTGHWVYYGFGMACMYAGDYRSVGGFNTSMIGWGGEDVDLYQRHIQSPLKVFRAAEPGLIHIFHNKTCSSSLTQQQMVACLGSAAESLGSKQQLGKYILQKRQKG